jgi:hypothetical protein
MGFLAAAVAVGQFAYSEIQDNQTKGFAVTEYYPKVRQGQILCPGPYTQATIAQLTQAFERNADLYQTASEVVKRLDGAWTGDYAPLTPAVLASALVNWAHGGRNCDTGNGEEQFARIIDNTLATDTQRFPPNVVAQGTGAVTEALAGTGVSPLQLGLAGLSAFLLLRGR